MCVYVCVDEWAGGGEGVRGFLASTLMSTIHHMLSVLITLKAIFRRLASITRFPLD